jgi:hypothetical protein
VAHEWRAPLGGACGGQDVVDADTVAIRRDAFAGVRVLDGDAGGRNYADYVFDEADLAKR